MEKWKRYYQETVVLPFKEQSKYYGYLLEMWRESFWDDAEERLAILGGMNHKSTKPGDFEMFCDNFLGKNKTLILDHNLEPIRTVSGSNSMGAVGALENLPISENLASLMICDFTLDFMDDNQIKSFSKSWSKSSKIDSLLLVSIDNPPFRLLTRDRYKKDYDLEVFYRSPEKLADLMSELKLVYCATGDRETYVLMFGQKEFVKQEHSGNPYGLNTDNPNFMTWVEENKSKF